MQQKKRYISLPWERAHGFSLWTTPLRSIVFAVGGALLLVAFVAYSLHYVRLQKTLTVIDSTRRAIMAFKFDVGRCPSSIEELMNPPNVSAHYLEELPVDAWGRPLRVSCPSANNSDDFDVTSAGPSGSFQTSDNIQ